MIPATPSETKRQLQKELAVYAIPISLDGRKSAYLGVAIGFGLVRNWDRTFQNGTNHSVHFATPFYPNSKPNKVDVDCGIFTRNKIDMGCGSRGNVAQMRNKFRESPITGYRT